MTDTRIAELARLRAVVAAYGADSERWPAAERDTLRALLAASPDARAIVGDERSLDRALALLDPPAPSEALTARLTRWPLPRAADAPRRGAGIRSVMPVTAAAAAAAAVAIGWLAWTAPPDDGPAPTPTAPAGVVATVESADQIDIAIVNTAMAPIGVAAAQPGDFAEGDEPGKPFDLAEVLPVE
ncbi:MAG: hypothetical protein FJX61_02180 [Alphaproteobacteria bacterium]|nr:hypothetical protein [Alphaproteobacteria bacterium]